MFRIAVGRDTDRGALESVWALAASGYKLHSLTEEYPVLLMPPYVSVTYGPVEGWHAAARADLFVGRERRAAEQFVRAGYRAILVGEGKAHINLAVVEHWAAVPDAVEFFRALCTGPKIQIEYPASVPGFVPDAQPEEQHVFELPFLHRQAGAALRVLRGERVTR